MLVLTRKLDESIIIGGDIEVKILKISGNQIHLGIDAPRHIPLYRKEVYERVVEENRRALNAGNASQDMLDGLSQIKRLLDDEGN